MTAVIALLGGVRATVFAGIALLALLEVLFGIALAWLGAGETPQSSVLLGGSLVIGALVVNEWLGLLQRRTTP